MTKNIFIIIAFLLTGFLNKSVSCSCIGESTVKDAVKGSELVVAGQVLSKDIIKTHDTLDLGPNQQKDLPVFTKSEAIYKVLVLTKYKGKIKSDTLTIITGVGGGDCGYEFEVGKKYIIYGSNEKHIGYGKTQKLPSNTFTTDICTRTVSYNDKEITEIKKITG